MAMYRSRSVSLVDVPGLDGIIHGAKDPMNIVIKPSKKKMLRHVCIGVESVPQRGIRANPVASRPPNAPAIEAAET